MTIKDIAGHLRNIAGWLAGYADILEAEPAPGTAPAIGRIHASYWGIVSPKGDILPNRYTESEAKAVARDYRHVDPAFRAARIIVAEAP